MKVWLIESKFGPTKVWNTDDFGKVPIHLTIGDAMSTHAQESAHDDNQEFRDYDISDITARFAAVGIEWVLV